MSALALRRRKQLLMPSASVKTVFANECTSQACGGCWQVYTTPLHLHLVLELRLEDNIEVGFCSERCALMWAKRCNVSIGASTPLSS